MTTTKLRKSDVAPILNLLGSDYKGRKFSLSVQKSYTVDNADLIWSGGSKKTVHFLRQSAGKWEIVDISTVLPNVYSNGMRMRQDLPENVMVVEHDVFQGTDCGYTFIVAPGSAFLPRAIGASTVAGALA